LPEYIWGFLLSNHVDLLAKLIPGTKPLAKFGEVNATTTAAEADEYGQYLTEKNKSECLKVVNTGTIDRYVSQWGNIEMTHARERYLTPYLPLKAAGVNKRRKEMYKLPKVIFAKMAKTCEALIDTFGEFASFNTNCFYRPTDDLDIRFVGAFCNSKLFMFFYTQFFSALRMSGGYFQFQAPQLRVVPFKCPTPNEQASIAALADRIIKAKRTNPDADTSSIEAEIDLLIYKLFALTPDEANIVEEAIR
jgi:hypothetical protein